MCECCTEHQKDIYLPQLATVEEARLLNKTEMYLRLTTGRRGMGLHAGPFRGGVDRRRSARPR